MRTAPCLWLPAVLLSGLGTSPVLARSPRPEAPARQLVLRQDDGKPPTFLGYGLTERDARQHALDQAREWLAAKGGFDWTPPADYLLRKGLVRFVTPDKEELEKARNLKIAGPQEVVKMELAVTAAGAEEIQQVARDQRMKERQGLLARILGGLVALLVVAGGYLRLEEATRGYYTARLRLAAGVLLALIAALLFVA